jgi:microcystin-dependent protein
VQLTSFLKLKKPETTDPVAMYREAIADNATILDLLFQPGDLKASARSAAPDGWLLCDGSAVSRTTYADLFTALGTTYGAGNGTTTFNLPDLRGRVPVGAGTGAGDGVAGSGLPTGAALTARTRGQYGGKETHLLSGAESGVKQHGHTASQAAHSHTPAAGGQFATNQIGMGGGLWGFLTAGHFTAAYGSAPAGSYDLQANGGTATATATPAVTVNDKAAENASSAHNNVQPFQVVNWLIKF